MPVNRDILRQQLRRVVAEMVRGGITARDMQAIMHEQFGASADELEQAALDYAEPERVLIPFDALADRTGDQVWVQAWVRVDQPVEQDEQPRHNETARPSAQVVPLLLARAKRFLPH